jgi:hypothetical protein
MKKLVLTAATLVVASMAAVAEPILVLTSTNRLLTIDHATPETTTRDVAITGLASGENMVAIDFRPATGVLFGISSTSRMYSIDINTGVATAIGSAGAFSIVGTVFDMDFNPTVDRIRFVSDSDQNLRLNPNNGGLAATDGLLRYATSDPNAGTNANIIAVGYANNFSGAASTVLYGVDSGTDALVIQDPPNEGILNTVGPLGVNATGEGGFDISPSTGVAYAALNVGGTPNLYTVNLRTGAVSPSNGSTTIPPVIAPATRGAANVIDIAALGVPGTRMRNISTRGRVTTGENILIAGFISRGGGATTPGSSRFVIRALGPSLSGFGVSDPLQDPVLTVFDNNRNVVASNDNFSASADRAAIIAAGFGPSNGNESAVLVTLPAGSYTAHVTANGTGGVGIVEVYELP